MFLLCVMLSTFTVGVLYAVTSTRRAPVDNRQTVLEWLRLAGHVILWGALLSSLISVFIPSPWS